MLNKSILNYFRKCFHSDHHRKLIGFRAYCEGNTNKTSSPKDKQWPRRIVTGLQPTGALHVGNYFGAIRRCVQMQDKGEDLTIFIADLHSLTINQNLSPLQDNIYELTAYLLASGIDPERSVLFAQSDVARHSELCWILTCLATHARLAHLPQFKEKSATMKEIPLGLLLYPVLQAADILIYRGTHVPVGIDQVQHLQIASQLVRTFHHRYGIAFPTPKPILTDDGSDNLKSLRDASKKMSKSDPNPKSKILLSDSDETIKLKIRKAVTDFTPHITYDPKTRPGVSNLVTLHCLGEDKTPEEVVEEADGLNTVQYKAVVAEALCNTLAPIRERAQNLMTQKQFLREVLKHGAAKARRRADEVYEDVSRLLGIAPAHNGDSHSICRKEVKL